MKFTIVALAAATAVSAARFNMAPLNLRNANVEVRTQEIHPTPVERDVDALNSTIVERTVAPLNATILESRSLNSTVAKRAVAFGTNSTSLFKN